MIKNNCVVGIVAALLLWSQAVFSIPNSQVDLDISAESIARIALYYEDRPLNGKEFDFPLPINGISQKFENTSSFFHLIGNVDNAEIVFLENNFVLPQVFGGNTHINLDGSFIHQGGETDSTKKLRLPVLKNISQATTSNGFKVKFISEFLAVNYTKGKYENTFTLIVMPIL